MRRVVEASLVTINTLLTEYANCSGYNKVKLRKYLQLDSPHKKWFHYGPLRMREFFKL